MKKKTILAVLLMLFISQSLLAAVTADKILDNVKAVINAPKVQRAEVKFVLIDKRGKKKERKALIVQKGEDKRLIRFTYPASQKGISFLSLPDDVMYLYLPAFKKVRRIASHIKNQKFAGTDFSYDDLSTTDYKKDYNAKLLSESDMEYKILLTPKPKVKKDYKKVLLWVSKDNFYPTRMESYNKAGKLWKVMVQEGVKKFNKKYWVATHIVMKDLKTKHSTEMVLEKVEFDISLPNNYFTKRYLTR